MSLKNIRIVLVSPAYGGNVGGVCRAMANMGLSDLALAEPRELDMGEARMMACHAAPMLARMQRFSTLGEAVADCSMVIGTTARTGLYRQHARTPREWAPQAIAAAQSNRVALVFGTEQDGLSNADVAHCTQMISIPSHADYESLNLSQAVLICAYELYLASGEVTPRAEKSPEAPAALRERMLAMWETALLKIGFMTDEKAEHMMLGLGRIFGRGSLTVDDVRILMGIARQTDWAVDAARSLAEGAPAPVAPAEVES